MITKKKKTKSISTTAVKIYKIWFKVFVSGFEELRHFQTEECGVTKKSAEKIFLNKNRGAKILMMKLIEEFECPNRYLNQYKN